MAIPASFIVEINPRVLQAGASDLETNGLLLTKNGLIPTSSIVLQFTSAATVGEYFGTASDEYAQAVIYFNGYVGKTKSPTTFNVARRIDVATGAFLRGAKYRDTLSAIQAITSGNLSVTVDGTPINLTGVDLSAATSYSDAAATLTAALSGVVTGTLMEYSSLTGAFVISSPSVGAASSISFASGSIANLFKLNESAGAVISQGSDALTAVDNFTAIREVTDNWVCFWTLWEADADEMLELAQWSTSQGVNYLYLPWSSDATLLVQGSNSPAEVFEDNQVSATALQWLDIRTSAFIAGIAASINWNRPSGTVGFAFRQQSGLTATVESESEMAVLEGRKVNGYGNFATRNDNFIWLYPACMFGEYGFIDTYINAVWFNNAIQAAIMNGLRMSSRTPYNETGYSKIRAWIMDAVNRARNNGVIDPGVTLSETQISELTQEAGRDISGELFTNGYVLQITDAGAAVRVNRDSPNISIWYTYAGNVQRIVVASTAII